MVTTLKRNLRNFQNNHRHLTKLDSFICTSKEGKYDCLNALTPNMFAPLCLDLAPRRPTVFVAAIVASPSTGTRGIVGGFVTGSQAGTPNTAPTVGRSGIGSRDGAK